MQEQNNIVLTISLLVSNRINTIRKCMESLRPFLEQLPAELIVVDTIGEEKSDGSLAIAKEYATKVVHFDWCNDFSAARNAGLELAQGEWFLYLDDDEWFDDVQEIIDFFKTGEAQKYNSAYYYTRDYDAQGNYSTGIAGRMIRRNEATRFVGKIHERFNDVQGPHKQFSTFVHHSGYAFSDKEAAKKHQERNLSILKKELAAEGETPRVCAQLVQELLSRDETLDAGFKLAKDFLKHHKGTDWIKDSCAQWVIVATVRYFSRKKDYAGAKKQYTYVHQQYELNEMSRLAVNGILAEMAAVRELYPEAFDYVNKYVSLWDWQWENEEAALVQMNLDMPKYIQSDYYYKILQIGTLAADRIKNVGAVKEFLKRLPLDKQREIIKKDPALIKSDIKLTIGMLVSNHKQYIRKAMEALKPLLEAVSSELVVIDTMGDKTDGSIDIVKEYTDKIYPFTWCNDFSAARNFCLSKANGEWFMYQDDDEWFDDVQEFIDFFNSGECEEYHAGFYYTRDYLQDGSFSTGIAGRMIRRTEATRFIGRVHEHFEETFAPNKQFNCFTHHYGYKHETNEQRLAKQKRNVDILKAEITECGLTAFRAAQLVQELLVCEETLDEGLAECMDSIHRIDRMNAWDNSCSQWLATALVRYYIMKKDYPGVFRMAEEVLTKCPLSQTAKLVVAATVAPAALDEERYDLIAYYCDLFLENYDWREANPEKALEQVNLDFPKFFTESRYHDIILMAAAVANHYGNYRKANAYWKRLPLGKEGFDATRFMQELNRTVQGLKELADLEQFDAKKKEALALLEAMAEAHEAVQAEIGSQSKEYNVAQGTPGYGTDGVEPQENSALAELLTGLQEAAITVGTSLDALLSEGSKEVSLLEQYCEKVWQCSQSQAEEQLAAVEEMTRLLDRVHRMLSNKRNIAKPRDFSRKEIVFFPYKASMWDSLESVYLAAKKDPDCDVYCVPIPYYDMKPNRVFDKLHYEVMQFPENIKVTDVLSYHFEERKPDVVYIHNLNVASFAHQRFHSANLRRITKKIVYV